MQGLPDTFATKSYEVGYALFRVAGTLPERSFKAHLEDKAIDLIVMSLEGRIADCKRTIGVAEYLVRFLSDIGMVHVQTASMLLQEIAGLDSAIAEFSESGAPLLAKEELFPAKTARTGELFKEPKTKEAKSKDVASAVPAEVQEGSDIRQLRILERIRQSGNCRLRDIQEFLPDISERTLRYDLQNLVQDGHIERVGNSGPSTFYKAKQSEGPAFLQ